MERLTNHTPDSFGYAEYELKLGIDEQDAINRLTAYEDSSLEPEEVADLARAKQEGRLVVLPCKVGDRISPSETVEEIIITNGGIEVTISESYSCEYGSGIRHRREKYMDKKLNLCDSCKKCFADCDNGKEGKDFFFWDWNRKR